jgi:ABC-type transport system involved in cytochrome c biogenesis permease subunit
MGFREFRKHAAHIVRVAANLILGSSLATVLLLAGSARRPSDFAGVIMIAVLIAYVASVALTVLLIYYLACLASPIRIRDAAPHAKKPQWNKGVWDRDFDL